MQFTIEKLVRHNTFKLVTTPCIDGVADLQLPSVSASILLSPNITFL